jgi:hypothetical protein
LIWQLISFQVGGWGGWGGWNTPCAKRYHPEVVAQQHLEMRKRFHPEAVVRRHLEIYREVLNTCS